MVCGTTSNAGKTTVVAGLCRLLARAGVRVAPFKAQNMALNSVVTPSGHEIGRAQGLQAAAAGVVPTPEMNPALLKPTVDASCEVVVHGKAIGDMTAAEYHSCKPRLLPLVLESLADLRARFDVVLCEGAGSPAEINLLNRDIVNLRIAQEAEIPAIVVGDIDLGGVFAALYGTLALLPDHFRRLVHGFVINKFRGDPELLFDGCAQLNARTGVPTLGILPYLDGVALDAEDSLNLPDDTGATPRGLDVVVVRLPHLANFTDLDPLRCEPSVGVRFVETPAALGDPDLVVLPGTKSTVGDLAWLRATGFDRVIHETDAALLGICGGYQMLGQTIEDDVESSTGLVPALGLLPVTTRFEDDKITRPCRGTSLGHPVAGYRIHRGRIHVDGGDPFVEIDGAVDGVVSGSVYGTTLHGLFESDAFRRAFLTRVATRAEKQYAPTATTFAAARDAAIDRVADLLERHLDLAAIERLIGSCANAAAQR
jgi:adenosylcobyric acid synthase